MNVDTVFEHVLHENVLSRGGVVVEFFVADVFGVSIVENHPLLSYFFLSWKNGEKGVCNTFLRVLHLCCATCVLCEYASMRPFF